MVGEVGKSMSISPTIAPRRRSMTRKEGRFIEGGTMSKRKQLRRRTSYPGGYALVALDGASHTRTRRHSVRQSSNRRRNSNRPKSSLKMYLFLTFVCFLAAVAGVFITGQEPEMIRSVIKRQLQTVMSQEGERLKRELQKEMSARELQTLRGRYERYELHPQ